MTVRLLSLVFLLGSVNFSVSLAATNNQIGKLQCEDSREVHGLRLDCKNLETQQKVVLRFSDQKFSNRFEAVSYYMQDAETPIFMSTSELHFLNYFGLLVLSSEVAKKLDEMFVSIRGKDEIASWTNKGSLFDLFAVETSYNKMGFDFNTSTLSRLGLSGTSLPAFCISSSLRTSAL